MNYYEKHLFLIMLIGLSTITIMGALMIDTCNAELNDIELFLKNDTTDNNTYLPWYTCGHYARDLARNASDHNLSIGSVILGNHPVFRGPDNHLVNYVMVNETIVIIDPRSDNLFAMNPSMTFDGRSYKYYRLYPDGTQIPTYWVHNLAHTGVI